MAAAVAAATHWRVVLGGSGAPLLACKHATDEQSHASYVRTGLRAYQLPDDNGVTVWVAQVDLSTGFPVPLAYSPQRSVDESAFESWRAAQRYADAQAAAQAEAQVNPSLHSTPERFRL